MRNTLVNPQKAFLTPPPLPPPPPFQGVIITVRCVVFCGIIKQKEARRPYIENALKLKVIPVRGNPGDFYPLHFHMNRKKCKG